ncbi:MAG TPA: hypothetical protein VLM38_24030 [Blastocatellia bacterium]|nr:hypothetical protein [Blastocatellia bacterium]
MKGPKEGAGRGSNRLTRVVLRLAFASAVFVSISGFSGAQPQLPEPPLPVDPTPIDKLLTATDKSLLADAGNPKKLVEAYLRISDIHLQAAFGAIKSNDHRSAERELDIYNKAVAEAGKGAFALQDGKRGAAKKIEQSLYRQIKTLESIERLFPAEREAFAEAALKNAKQLRVHALNAALASGNGVLNDPDEEKKPQSEPPAKDPQVKEPPLSPPLALSVVGLRRSLVAFAGRVSASSYLRGSGFPQIPGDYLTEEEDDHVREAQAADARAKVFMKIADRRIKAITGVTPSPAEKKDQKRLEEEEREWGALPKLSRAELLRHYARAIAECMAKLEDAYERNPKSSALPKALAVLRDSTDKHLLTLRALATDMKDEAENAALRQAVEEAETANKGARDGLK